MIRVLICDDQDVVREGLHAILRTAQGISVIGIAGDGATAIELTLKHKPDLVLMDLNMPGMTGIQATRIIREKAPEVQVLALTTYDADEWILDAIRAGAAGYLLKDTPRAGLVQAIEGTYAGQTFVDPAIAGKLFSHVARATTLAETTITASLNPREHEILKLLARGMSNAEIAAQLFLSEGTVRNYVSSLFSKLNVNDRTQAAVIALRYGLAD
ncbi:MAG: DNA-binding response regulator [Chloroflexi bacterium UTCFX4]|jgi:DNA-binding NarL/FixJ family response regulator|nr:MAG: DNA-binding response regulator [Chloroflexi bacterium UTCFX4]